MNRLLPYAQLVRLPNVFTAWADILLAALAMGALPDQVPTVVFLLLASTALYWGGMVWNDYFDLDQDRRERPFRPLPSGRIAPRSAVNLGMVLFLAGLLFATLADRAEGRVSPANGPAFFTAVCLLAAILAYDSFLKRTWAGPLAMGLCRFLNVLLGLTVGGTPGVQGYLLALIVGLYIVGVTWFARTEARESNAALLSAAAGTMLLAALLALALPGVGMEAGVPSRTSLLFPYLLVGFILFVGLPVRRAIRKPIPPLVQKAVKRAVLGLVLLDAVLATALVGIVGVSLVLLLVPAYGLGRWLYST